jgi:DNA-binding transcriptional ArsR family regulator
VGRRDRRHYLSIAFHALSDPTRRDILNALREGPVSAANLARPFDQSFQSVAQHLAFLEEAGLISSDRCGGRRLCRIEPRALIIAELWLKGLREGISQSPFSET